MHSQRREQGRIALSWEDAKTILIEHFIQSGDIPSGAVRQITEVEFWDDDDGPAVEVTFSSAWDKSLSDKPDQGDV